MRNRKEKQMHSVEIEKQKDETEGKASEQNMRKICKRSRVMFSVSRPVQNCCYLIQFMFKIHICKFIIPL